MVKLIAKTACDGLLPVTAGSCVLSELTPANITSIAPFTAQEKSVAATLKSALGLSWPAPNRSTGKDECRCIWCGQDQVFLLGPAPQPIAGAAMTDQSDGWAAMRLAGVDAEAVLARLVPLDLRAAHFKRGHSARSLINHMPASITRTGVDALDIMVFRSMAATAVQEISAAMHSVAAQAA